MDKGNVLRETGRNLLVLLVYLPPLMLTAIFMRGTWRAVAVAFITLAAFMTIDAAHGKLGRPVSPSAITSCLLSNALFIAVFGTCIAVGFHLL